MDISNTQLLADKVIELRAAITPEEDGTFIACVLMGPFRTSEEADTFSQCMFKTINLAIYDGGKRPPLVDDFGSGFGETIGH